jgi:hypothetical protein
MMFAHGDYVMLPLLLMLLSDPLPAPDPVAPPAPTIDFPITVVDCARTGFQRIEEPSGRSVSPLINPMHTPNGGVRRYLLLERSIRGCAAPISYAVPGRQGGFIRELGRPVPSVPPAAQPPRSSE